MEVCARTTSAPCDVKVGPEVQPFYAARPRRTSLQPRFFRAYVENRGWYRLGAGCHSYPKLNLIYHGTSNPGPWTPTSAKATKVDASILAADPAQLEIFAMQVHRTTCGITTR